MCVYFTLNVIASGSWLQKRAVYSCKSLFFSHRSRSTICTSHLFEGSQRKREKKEFISQQLPLDPSLPFQPKPFCISAHSFNLLSLLFKDPAVALCPSCL